MGGSLKRARTDFGGCGSDEDESVSGAGYLPGIVLSTFIQRRSSFRPLSQVVGLPEVTMSALAPHCIVFPTAFILQTFNESVAFVLPRGRH